MRRPLYFPQLLAAAAALSWSPATALDPSQLSTAEAEIESLVGEWQTE